MSNIFYCLTLLRMITANLICKWEYQKYADYTYLSSNTGLYESTYYCSVCHQHNFIEITSRSNQGQHTYHDAQFHRRGGEWTQAKQICDLMQS